MDLVNTCNGPLTRILRPNQGNPSMLWNGLVGVKGIRFRSESAIARLGLGLDGHALSVETRGRLFS